MAIIDTTVVIAWRWLSPPHKDYVTKEVAYYNSFSLCNTVRRTSVIRTPKGQIHRRTGGGGLPPRLSGNIRFTVGQYWLIIKINRRNSLNIGGNMLYK